MNEVLWKSSTKNIFIGILLYYLFDVISRFFGIFGIYLLTLEYIAEVGVLVGAIIYFLGLKNFRESVDDNDKKDVGQIYISIIAVIFTILGWKSIKDAVK